jgi:hypothetical protein
MPPAVLERVVSPGDGAAPDQAVVDAEFVAIVIAERPWAESQPSPRPTPPRSATRTRRRRPPPGARSWREPDQRLAVGYVRGLRRRPGPGPRSPPVHAGTPPRSTRR